MSNPFFDMAVFGILIILCFCFAITYWRTRSSMKLSKKVFLHLKKHLKFEEQQNKLNNEKLMLADNLDKLSSKRFFEISKELILAYQLLFDKKPN